MSIIYPVPIEKQKKAGLTADSQFIFAVLKLLKYEYRKKKTGILTNSMLVSQSKEWVENGQLPTSNFSPLENHHELSHAIALRKKAANKISQERTKAIRDLLEQMSILYGYRIKGVDGGRKDFLKVEYEVLPEKASTLKHVRPKSTRLAEYGLWDIVDENPTSDGDWQEALKEATEIRILQSAFYKNRFIIKMIKDTIGLGRLKKVQILLAQPFSDAARSRAHTYAQGGQDKYTYFNGSVTQRPVCANEPKPHSTPV